VTVAICDQFRNDETQSGYLIYLETHWHSLTRQFDIWV
jgi:hypothetical protein